MNEKLIGLIGLAGSGKDTAAEALRYHRNYRVLKFAGGLKAMLRGYFTYCGIQPREIERMLEGDLKNDPTTALGSDTPRHAMQTLGDEWGRQLLSPEIWVNNTMALVETTPRAVISDVRYPNEITAIRKRGGVIIRIVRDGVEEQAHASEAISKYLNSDFTLRNNGSITDLQASTLELEPRVFEDWGTRGPRNVTDRTHA